MSVPPDLHLDGDRQAVEAALRELPGVVAVRLVPGFERQVDELHLVADTSKGAKQLVRDAQSLLLARCGVTVDHRVVSVVQVGSSVLPTGALRRVAIRSVAAIEQELEVRVTVELSDGDTVYTGQSCGPASTAGKRRATARAALEAARSLLGRQVVEIEGVAVEHVLGHQLAITFVHFHSSRGERTAVGAAMVCGDESLAVTRSVLDALNRELPGPSA
ncbi:MAG TPA: hypothetical protein VHF25_07110 [Nitriliruptorales bacterium]|nr:hypothetical protein [Nitriliruptorales bacterium]